MADQGLRRRKRSDEDPEAPPSKLLKSSSNTTKEPADSDSGPLSLRFPSGTAPGFRNASKPTAGELLKNDWEAANNEDQIQEFVKIMVQGLIELETRGRKNQRSWYAKIRPIVQSTGTGKSKLVERLGEELYTLRLVLRKPMEIAFPPRDKAISELLVSTTDNENNDIHPEVYNVLLLRKNKYFQNENKDEQDRKREEIKPLAKLVWYHAVVAGFLEAAFDYVTNNIYQDGATQDLAPKDWNQKMRHDPDIDGQIWSETSRHRLEMSNTISEKAKDIALALVRDETWIGVWMVNASEWGPTLRDLQEVVGVGLRKAADSLVERLPEIRADKVENGVERFSPRFVLIIDEASNMPIDLLHAFGRTLSLIRDKAIWTLFLSTESKLIDTWPPDDQIRGTASSRAVSQSVQEGDKLDRPPPFIALPVGGSLNIWKEAKYISLEEAMSLKNMATIGRPLWKAYLPPFSSLSQNEPSAFGPLEKIISYKLLGSETMTSLQTLFEQKEPGDAVNREKYRKMVTASIFTCLSFLILLDPAVQSTGYLALMILLVDRYLRVLMQWDMSASFIKTMTPCEPVVSHYARKLMCGRWDTALQKLADHLLHDGAVNKELCGELFVRLLFILARDGVKKGDHEAFTFKDLLDAMFGWKTKVFGKLPDELLNASMNFNHFIDTESALRLNTIEDLCHRLIRTCTALQHKEGQAAFDCSVPFEFKARNSETFRGLIFAQSKLQMQSTNPADMLCTGSLEKPVSVKVVGFKGAKVPLNRLSSTKGSAAMREVLLRKGPDGQQFPTLVILFDLGCDMKQDSKLILYQGMGMENNKTYVLHAKGHDRGLFRCLQTQGVTESTVNKLFNELSRDQQPNVFEQEILRSNRLFG